MKTFMKVWRLKKKKKKKNGSRAWQDQPTDHIWAFIASRIAEIKASDELKLSKYCILHIAQSSGYYRPTPQIATHGKRVVPPLSSERKCHN